MQVMEVLDTLWLDIRRIVLDNQTGELINVYILHQYHKNDFHNMLFFVKQIAIISTTFFFQDGRKFPLINFSLLKNTRL